MGLGLEIGIQNKRNQGFNECVPMNKGFSNTKIQKHTLNLWQIFYNSRFSEDGRFAAPDTEPASKSIVQLYSNLLKDSSI